MRESSSVIKYCAHKASGIYIFFFVTRINTTAYALSYHTPELIFIFKIRVLTSYQNL